MSSDPRHQRQRAMGRRRRKQRGAVLIEMVLIVPILMTLVMGMFEIGMMWNASQNVVQASRSGARTVSQLGTFGRADEEALRAVLATFGDEVDRVTRVAIYEYQATSPDGVHTDCALPGKSPGRQCNVYTAADLASIGDPTYFASDTGCASNQASRSWCPTGRSDAQATATMVGVEVQYRYTPVSGFFGVGDRTLTQRLVMKVEPN